MPPGLAARGDATPSPSPTWARWVRRARSSLAQLSGDRPTAGPRVVAVGPEGGWSADELASGLPTVGFGLSVLRAETAAVTAGALMASLRTGTVAPVADSAEADAGTGVRGRPGSCEPRQRRAGDR